MCEAAAAAAPSRKKTVAIRANFSLSLTWNERICCDNWKESNFLPSEEEEEEVWSDNKVKEGFYL